MVSVMISVFEEDSISFARLYASSTKSSSIVHGISMSKKVTGSDNACKTSKSSEVSGLSSQASLKD